MPTQAAAAGQANPVVFIVQFALIIAIFYFVMIRPQKAEQKKHAQMLKDLAKNDDIVTTGGIHGVVVNVKETTVVIRVDDNVKIEIEKNCVGYLKKSTNQGTKNG